MDPSDQALSHQIEIVEALAENFKRVVVLTGFANWNSTHPNIVIKCSNWQEGRNIHNVVQFYMLFFQIWKEFEIQSVFSHMVVIQSGLVAPFIRFKRVKHVLWYAHAKDSLYLRWTAFWVNWIATSTNGSCPIQNSKVVYLGQSIKSENFYMRILSESDGLKKIVHVGRNDKSKNIGLLINTVSDFRQLGLSLTLDLFGKPSNAENRSYFLKLEEEWKLAIEAGWLRIRGAVPRHDVANVLQNFDVFLHGFEGSLDKALLEATLCGVPVVTVNSEYLEQYGSWSKSDSINLENELRELLQLPENQLSSILRLRRDYTIQSHGFERWIMNLTQLLSPL
jgi:glycosyltransferase involved in cell wall biosynthesis